MSEFRMLKLRVQPLQFRVGRVSPTASEINEQWISLKQEGRRLLMWRVIAQAIAVSLVLSALWIPWRMAESAGNSDAFFVPCAVLLSGCLFYVLGNLIGIIGYFTYAALFFFALRIGYSAEISCIVAAFLSLLIAGPLIVALKQTRELLSAVRQMREKLTAPDKQQELNIQRLAAVGLQAAAYYQSVVEERPLVLGDHTALIAWSEDRV